MKRINEAKSFKKIVIIVLLLLFISVNLLPVLANVAGDCEEGAARCLFTAALTAIGNPAVGASIAAWCAVGYAWCKQYYV